MIENEPPEQNVGNIKQFNELDKSPDINKNIWQDKCLNTDAEKTVIGLQDAKADYRFMSVEFRQKKNDYQYRFDIKRQPSHISIAIRVTLLNIMMLCKQVDVVNSNVPFLFGLDILDKYQMIIKNFKDLLDCPYL